MGKLETQVKRFLQKVNEKYRLSSVIMFGSRVRNDYLEKSDIDLLLVSDDFEDIKFFERPSCIYEYWDWKSGIPLEVICYTENEFKRKKRQMGFVRTAVETGRAIWETGRGGKKKPREN